MSAGLKETVYDFLRYNMIEPCCGDKKDYVALITDQSTLQMISSVCSVHDINLAGVGVVLNLKFKRDQMPVSAIYFVNPTPKNVRKICNDFTKKRSMYRKVHLFFNGHVSGESMEMIRRNTRLVEKLSTLKEVNIHFFVEEDRVFSLRRASLQTMYPISKKRTAKELKDIAKGLASLCLTMNEFPYVRYMKSSECCENIARYFNDKIDSKIRKLSDWEYREKRAILLILDRNYDKVSPLMHEYTYKAMVADLLTLDKNFVEYKEGDKMVKQMLIDDPIWNEFSDVHIATVIREIPEKSKEFVSNNPLLKIKQTSHKQLKDLSKALNQAPQYKKLSESFSKNISIAKACMDKYKEHNLGALSEFEQDMATNLKEGGKVFTKKKALEKIANFMKDDSIATAKKLRLIMILQTSYANVPKSDIESLMESAKLNNKQKKACRNISFLGTTEEIPNEILERNKLIQKESKLNLSRYEPKIKNVLKEICEDTLSKKNFPYVQEPPPEKSMKRGRRKKNKEMCKIIVFVAGGLSYSEIRCCSEVSKTYSRDVIAGSTDVVSPKEFMRELIQIN